MSDKVSLTVEEMAEVRKIVDEIMLGQDRMHNPDVFRQYAEDVLVRHLTAAVQAYADQDAAEKTHSTDSTAKHDISDCSPEYCGRYRGQRRDSAESVERQAQALEDFSRYGCLDQPRPTHSADDCCLVNCVWHPSAPLAPAGPAADCVRCARSGVGVCDDYPDCPAGRRSHGAQ